MIRVLESKYKLEVKDLNWKKKRQYYKDSYNSCAGWCSAEEKIKSLEAQVSELKKGWRNTLEAAECWSNYMASSGNAVPEDVVPFVLHEGISCFEKVCEERYGSM